VVSDTASSNISYPRSHCNDSAGDRQETIGKGHKKIRIALGIKTKNSPFKYFPHHIGKLESDNFQQFPWYYT